MGDILSKHEANQSTTNNQVTSESGNAASVRGQGKGSSNVVGSGISLVLNTGGNKVSTKNGGKGKRGVSGQAAPATGGSQTGSGDINVAITQTDAGAIKAGSDVSLAAIGAIQDANENVITLAEHALQAGASVAAVAIPTYAASEIAGNAINPQPVILDNGGAGPADTGSSNKLLIGAGVILAALGVGILAKKKG